jgi:precorrin-2 dehydrogenase/sirohydrochlorin ferrochelatase
MFPLILNPEKTDILVIGDGPATTRRIELLQEANADFEHIETDEIAQSTFSRAGVVFIADFDDFTSGQLYEQAKLAGCLVNVEDKKAYCDFHVPAMVRRGELLLTVSTGGGSPRLARRLRMMLEQLFPESWADRLKQISKQRDTWKAEGVDFAGLAEKTDQLLGEKGWLEADCACVRAASFLSPSPQPSPRGGEGEFASSALADVSKAGEGAAGYKAKAPEYLRNFAKELRRNATDAESLIWLLLRNKQLGHKFRRQHPIGKYIVDFVCLKQKVIIEIDGSQHQDNTADQKRTHYLKSQGFRVIRFWNNQVLQETESVSQAIWEAVHSIPPTKSSCEDLTPPRGGSGDVV